MIPMRHFLRPAVTSTVCTSTTTTNRKRHALLKSQRHTTKAQQHPARNAAAAALAQNQQHPAPPLSADTGAQFEATCAQAGVEPALLSIGGGNMAQAMIQGFMQTGLLPASHIRVIEPDTRARQALQSIGIQSSSNSTDNPQMLEISNGIVLLAVKPNVLPTVAKQCRMQLQNARLVICVLAGCTLETLQMHLDDSAAIVRVMPNTAALIGRAASVFAANHNCTPAHCAVVAALMSTVGSCHQVPESLLDAVTGLSGSGPAYVYTVIDAMADGGVKMGLPRDLAIHLAAQTVMGASEMVLSTGEHPSVLRNNVCSPGGTTIAGVHSLEESGVRGAFMSAIEAAVLRARQLAAPANK